VYDTVGGLWVGSGSIDISLLFESPLRQSHHPKLVPLPNLYTLPRSTQTRLTEFMLASKKSPERYPQNGNVIIGMGQRMWVLQAPASRRVVVPTSVLLDDL